jgi:hypothetical protein
MKAKSKMIIEKKTGEKYASKSAMMKHEKNETMPERLKEYGKKKTPSVKAMPKKMVKK